MEIWRFAHAEVPNYALRRRIEAENNGNKYLKIFKYMEMNIENEFFQVLT
jgi:hypothetical protein